VIVGTDGLFDNVYDGEMLDAINEKQHNALETAIAKALVRRAVVFASITTRISPFAAAASKYGYTNVVGGYVVVCSSSAHVPLSSLTPTRDSLQQTR